LWRNQEARVAELVLVHIKGRGEPVDGGVRGVEVGACSITRYGARIQRVKERGGLVHGCRWKKRDGLLAGLGHRMERKIKREREVPVRFRKIGFS
jgi:hypothetical protein